MYFLLGRSADAVWLQIELQSRPGRIWLGSGGIHLPDLSPDSLPVASDVSERSACRGRELPLPLLRPRRSSPAIRRRCPPAPPLRLRPAPAGNRRARVRRQVCPARWCSNLLGRGHFALRPGEQKRLLTGGFDRRSADGSKVAFTRDGGENGVYVIDIATGEERLIFGELDTASPKWSPDGRWIVFVRGDEYILSCKNIAGAAALGRVAGRRPARKRTATTLARVSTADGGEDTRTCPFCSTLARRTGPQTASAVLGRLQITQGRAWRGYATVYFDIRSNMVWTLTGSAADELRRHRLSPP